MLNRYSLLILGADVNQGGGGWVARRSLVILDLQRGYSFYSQDSRLEVRRKDSPVPAWSPGRAAWRLLLVGAKHPRATHCLNGRNNIYGCFALTSGTNKWHWAMRRRPAVTTPRAVWRPARAERSVILNAVKDLLFLPSRFFAPMFETSNWNQLTTGFFAALEWQATRML